MNWIVVIIGKGIIISDWLKEEKEWKLVVNQSSSLSLFFFLQVSKTLSIITFSSYSVYNTQTFTLQIMVYNNIISLLGMEWMEMMMIEEVEWMKNWTWTFSSFSPLNVIFYSKWWWDFSSHPICKWSQQSQSNWFLSSIFQAHLPFNEGYERWYLYWRRSEIRKYHRHWTSCNEEGGTVKESKKRRRWKREM